MIHVNGWRRFWLVLVGLAFASCVLLAGVEWFGKQAGVFVYRMLVTGSTIDVLKNQVVLPDGTEVKLTQSLNGLEPWEIDWNKEPAAAPVLVLNWRRVVKLGLLLPLAVWLAIEVVALAARWILREFGVRRKELR